MWPISLIVSESARNCELLSMVFLFLFGTAAFVKVSKSHLSAEPTLSSSAAATLASIFVNCKLG